MLPVHEQELNALLAIFGEYGVDSDGCIERVVATTTAADACDTPVDTVPLHASTTRWINGAAEKPKSAATACNSYSTSTSTSSQLAVVERQQAATQFNVVCARVGEGGMALDNGTWAPQLVAILAVELPLLYPVDLPPVISLMTSTKVSTDTFSKMQNEIDCAVAEHFSQGTECLLAVVSRVLELYEEYIDPELRRMKADDTSETSDDEDANFEFNRSNTSDLESPQSVASHSPASFHRFLSPKACDGNVVLGRRVCYSHHIRAPTKREFIIRWALELSLSGVSKVGYPGIIIVEGLEPHCEEYVWRLKRLRWKHFVCRGQESVLSDSPNQTVDGLRKFPRGFVELGPGGDSMSELAKYCRESGLEHLFLASMRIQKSN